MKKPTQKLQKWHYIHAKKMHSRQYRKSVKYHLSPHADYHRLNRSIARGFTYRITCPENFSLQDNFDGVIHVLDQIRKLGQRARNERIYVDFRPIRHLSPTAALALAAELDRWNSNLALLGGKLSTVDVEEWFPSVRRQLGDMGFFNLLNARYPKELQEEDGHEVDTRYVEFRSGLRVEGKVIEELREFHLDPYVSVPNRRLLFAAVTEAMTNVVHHAYPRERRVDGLKKWWLSASRNVTKKEVSILIYDQGLSIPKTLPRNFSERIREMLPDGLSSDDARMIQAAHELSRSATREWNRGHGLQRDIRRYASQIGQGAIYRVTRSLRRRKICA